MHTDGNAVAGLLREIFTAELTAAERRCESCGQRRPIAEHRHYEGAGHVLRCPACGDIGAIISVRPNGYMLHLRGTWLVASAP